MKKTQARWIARLVSGVVGLFWVYLVANFADRLGLQSSDDIVAAYLLTPIVVLLILVVAFFMLRNS